MARHTTGTVVIHPTVRRNPGALLRALASLATSSALVELARTFTRSPDNRLIIGVVGAMASIYGVLTYSRWRSRNRIEVDDGFVMVYTTAERHGVWFRRADIRCLAADHHDVQVVGAQGIVGTLGSTDWHGRPLRTLTDAIGCRSRGIWPPAVLAVPAGALAKGAQHQAVGGFPAGLEARAGSAVRQGHRGRRQSPASVGRCRESVRRRRLRGRADGPTRSGCACRHAGPGGSHTSP
jgi:hypothetical protein